MALMGTKNDHTKGVDREALYMPRVMCIVARRSILLWKHLSGSSANFWGIPVVGWWFVAKLPCKEIVSPDTIEDSKAKKVV